MAKLTRVEKSASFLLFEKVAAGFPSPAADYEGKRISLDELCIKNWSATYFMVVEGDSMKGAGIFDGDLVVIDRSRKAKIGDVIVTFLNGGYTVKYLRKYEGLVYLSPANPDYPPIPIQDLDNFEIWGVVTRVVHALS